MNEPKTFNRGISAHRGDSGRSRPEWLAKSIFSRRGARVALSTRSKINRLGLETICSQARCPNIGECYSESTATFLILGDGCSRSCRFCAVKTSRLSEPDNSEPARLARAAIELGLDHIVLTSGSRDDLPDGGASHFARCARALKESLPESKVEILTPDFGGSREALSEALSSPIDFFGHNMETVRRLTPKIRSPRSSYERSLWVLESAKGRFPELTVKSSIMVGFSETESEIVATLADMKRVGVDVALIGQYLQPARAAAPVEKFYEPGWFESIKKIGEESVGLKLVVAGPYVRSSYRAGQIGAELGV